MRRAAPVNHPTADTLSRLASRYAIVVLLVAFGGVYYSTLGSYGMFIWDEAHYATLGRALHRGLGYTDFSGAAEAFRPPVLPASVALAMSIVGGESDVTAKLPILVFALACLLLVYRTVEREHGVFGGIVAACSLAVFPTFWSATGKLLTEIPFMLFYAAAVFAFQRGLERHPAAFVVAWLSFAAALLTRYTAVLYGPTLIAMTLLILLLCGRPVLRRLLTWQALISPLIAAVILLPWLGWVWVNRGDPLWGFREASAQIPLYSSHGAQPVYYYLTILPQMLGWPLAALLAAAVVHAVAARDRLSLSSLVAAGVIIGWMTQYAWKEPRLVTAVLPFVAVVLGVTAAAALRFVRSHKEVAPWQHAIGAAALAAAVWTVYSNHQAVDFVFRHQVALGYPSFLQAMRDLRDRTAPGALVVGPNCYQIHWYADLPCHFTPNEPDRLAPLLADADWFVAVNFERGQPPYVRELVKRFRRAEIANGHIRVFQDKRNRTVVAPANLVP